MATEDIRPSSTAFSIGNLVGAATVHAALADASDSTYIDCPNSYVDGNATWDGALTDLVGSSDVASFVVIVRASGSAMVGTDAIGVSPSSAGVAFAGPQTASPSSSTIANFTIGPITKSGGGNFTAAQINAMTMDVQVNNGNYSGDARLIAVTVRVTYFSGSTLTLSATQSGAVALARAPAKVRVASTATAPTLARAASRTRAASTAASAMVALTVSRTCAAASTVAATVARVASGTRGGSLGSSPSVGRIPSRRVSASISAAALLARVCSRALSSASPMLPDLILPPVPGILTATVGSTGSWARAIARSVASSSPLAGARGLLCSRALTASASAVAARSFAPVARTLAAASVGTALLARAVSRTRSATTTLIASKTRLLPQTVTATIGSSAIVVRARRFALTVAASVAMNAAIRTGQPPKICLPTYVVLDDHKTWVVLTCD